MKSILGHGAGAGAGGRGVPGVPARVGACVSAARKGERGRVCACMAARGGRVGAARGRMATCAKAIFRAYAGYAHMV